MTERDEFGCRDLTKQERLVVNLLADAWSAFLSIPVGHGDDLQEFRGGIHRLQEKVMCRPIREAIK